ncbi:MAG: glycosyl transferase family 1, partial [Bacteroidia bacterium]|nr:glycosyl transferase family 1 [Bacteroidia bacterium]
HLSSRSIITGKLFEYLASGKPVICLGPVDGDAAKILEETGHGKTFDYNDSAGISEYLTILSSNPEITEKVPHTIYSRENLVKKVIALLI